MVHSRASRVIAFTLGLAVAPVLAGDAARAQDSTFDLGLRGSVMLGDGQPSNDVLGAGLLGHWWASPQWGIGFAVDHVPEFDVERTPDLLGIPQDPELEDIDNKATATGLRVWYERRYGRPERRTEWFWGIGAGIDVVDVDDVEGRTAGGAPLLIRVDAGTEPILTALGGVRWRLGDRWLIEFALRAEEHFADWSVEDVESGETASVSDYLLTGGSLGITWRF